MDKIGRDKMEEDLLCGISVQVAYFLRDSGYIEYICSPDLEN